ncbi:hypothetical protein GCM10009789_17120 [Kribbella sancticallisti]|uniref:Uncharacterized protein n=1 Tax=Kribbella sancticallisti TaxID=460087 RepID=A0ABN2CW83_9ACTN
MFGGTDDDDLCGDHYSQGLTGEVTEQLAQHLRNRRAQPAVEACSRLDLTRSRPATPGLPGGATDLPGEATVLPGEATGQLAR